MVKIPNRPPDMLTDIHDKTNNIIIKCEVWFSGNEIIVFSNRYNSGVIASQKDGVWLYRHSWKQKRQCVSSPELIEALKELAMQRAIEKGIKNANRST